MDPENNSPEGLSIVPSRLQGPSNTDPGSAGKRRPVRRDPEKRRQQNIQAQKKYREKIKKRLEQLETFAASVRDESAVSSEATPEAGSNVAPVPGSSPSTSTTVTQRCAHHDMQQNDGFDFFDFSVDFFNHTPSHPKPAACTDTALSSWDPSLSVDLTHLIQNKDTTSRSQYWVGFIDCGCVRPHVQVSSETSRDWGDMKVLSIGPSLLTPDPYMNTLRVERICILQAIMSNCLQIGITEEMFCGEDAISPFFRSRGKAVDESGSDNTVMTVQRIFKTLKPDVRPIKEQVTMMHRPVIDVLPFPTFRKNLITSGDAIHEEELYHDLLNGLICWGGAGVGKKDRDTSTGHTSTGTPWDSRSWEARVWFLQKYWTLLGGEEGELVRQSEWWRNMRGDEDDSWLGQ
ncbi:hypothetical protein J7T55_007618 [Diaporthe amygdali]|uniref:uncharacterized protein n=1 Tax=Phomopsis amygdali TaxID=1214568 RepID=UPI0022FDB355|nr:uncharacterized protein J7T55_007618 [Diaporthe amygdali]KAJ0107248.1 hypothetical protein J7T55_007618 [Diaporthe amygdali]